MDPLVWMGSIVITFVLGFLFGRKIDKSYEFARWLGFGLGGFWLIWTSALSLIFVAYMFYGRLALYPAIFFGIMFHQNHRRMRRSRRNEELVADIDRLDNEVLAKKIQTVIKDPIGVLQTPEAHHKRLMQALKTANETVIILSSLAIDLVDSEEFKTLLGRCLKRGVMVYIGYGYQKPDTERPEQEVIKEVGAKLEKLVGWCTKKKWEGRLEVYYYPSHPNTLIKDDSYAIIGDYDWLSDRGTQENTNKSWVLTNKEFVAEERDKIVMAQ